MRASHIFCFYICCFFVAFLHRFPLSQAIFSFWQTFRICSDDKVIPEKAKLYQMRLFLSPGLLSAYMVDAKPVSSSSHILILDSNPDELRLLVETLRGKGYRLSIAFDGEPVYDRAVADRKGT